MSNLQRKFAVEHGHSGYVVGVEGPFVRVRVDGAHGHQIDDEVELRAQRAVSCLVAPELGDHVLLGAVRDGRTFVLAVLEREDEELGLRVSTERNLVLESTSGRVDVVGASGVGVASAERVSIDSRDLTVRAEEAKVQLTELLYLGRRVLANAAKTTWVAETIETIADTLTQKFARAHRVVSEFDQLRAGHIDYAAQKAVRVHSQNTFLTAEQVVKLDGENIHLG